MGRWVAVSLNDVAAKDQGGGDGGHDGQRRKCDQAAQLQALFGLLLGGGGDMVGAGVVHGQFGKNAGNPPTIVRCPPLAMGRHLGVCMCIQGLAMPPSVSSS